MFFHSSINDELLSVFLSTEDRTYILTFSNIYSACCDSSDWNDEQNEQYGQKYFFQLQNQVRSLLQLHEPIWALINFGICHLCGLFIQLKAQHSDRRSLKLFIHIYLAVLQHAAAEAALWVHFSADIWHGRHHGNVEPEPRRVWWLHGLYKVGCALFCGCVVDDSLKTLIHINYIYIYIYIY